MRKLLTRFTVLAFVLPAVISSALANEFPGKGSFDAWLKAGTYYNQAHTLHKTGREKEAITAYNRAIQIYPYDAYYYFDRGVSEEKSNDWKNAESSYRQALRLNSQMWQAWNGLCSVYNEDERYSEALDACIKASRCSPPPPPKVLANLKKDIQAFSEALKTPAHTH
jgi:tetratricopeptide (TPR) repeat protein